MTSQRYALMLALFCLLLPAASPAITGREVYEKVQAVRNKSLDRKVEATMVLFDKGGGKRTRTLTEYSRNASPEAYKGMVVFNSPPDLQGVGFLVHAHTFSDRVLWAYFPDYNRVRRIPDSSQDDSFFGSDFSYDDFGGPPDLDKYSYKIMGEAVLEGRPCYMVEVWPKEKRKYSRYVSWVAKDLWVPTKVAYYRGKEVYRTGLFRDIRMVDGIPSPFELVMENMETGHRTVLSISRIEYGTNFPDEFFSQRILRRGGR
jgi:outer membrane lipoprotein-sorting protein